MSIKKISAVAAVSALALSLTACGDSTDQQPVTPTSTVTAATTVTEYEDDGADDADDAGEPAAAAAQDGLPAAVTGYTDEARQEMADEGVSEADVEGVLNAANGNEAGVEVEWDDEGYWEIEFGDIDIDINPEGTVLDVDRDD